MADLTRRRSKSCPGLLRYVDGDYNDPATFQALRKELRFAQRPAYYLAIPPVLFGTVVEQLGEAGCAGKGARVIVEKPFGTRPRLGAASSTRFCSARSTRSASSASTITSERSRFTTCSSSASPTPARAVLEPRQCGERADHHGGGLRRAGPRRFLRSDRHHPRRDAESSVPGAGQPGDGAARPHGQRIHPR